MNLFKKILFSFLLFTLTLTTISFLFSEKVHATGVNTVRVKAYSDTNNDHYWQANESAIAVPITFIGSDGSKTGTTKTTATQTDSPNTGELFFLTSRTNNSVELKNKAINGVYIHDDTHQRSWGLGSRALINTVGSATVYYAVKPCVRNNPSLSKTAVTPNPDKNTDNRVYYLTVKNNDSANCSLRSFQLNREMPSGWFATYSRLNSSAALTSIDLNPGQDEKLKLKITPPNSASGDHNITASAKAGSNKSNDVPLEYNLGSNLVCNRDPEITIGTITSNASSVTYPLTIKNNDDANCINSVFTVSLPTKPVGWNWDFRTPSGIGGNSIDLGLKGKQSLPLNLKISKAGGAANGDYHPIVKVQDIDQSRSVATKTLTYTVTGSNISKAPSNSPTGCNANPPGLTITDPSNKTRSGEAGAEKEYTIKVTNKDSGDCSSKTFVLTKEQLPNNNWTASFSTNNISLNQGASKEGIILKVKSPTTASAGEKPVSIGVKKSGQTTAQVKTNLTYIVKDPNISRAPSNEPSHDPSNGPSHSPSLSPTACQRKDPILTITQDKTYVKKGGKITYTIVVSNNDTASCADKNMTLSITLPKDNWTKTLSKNTLSMKPGANTSVTASVTSPDSATNGTKDVKFIIKNSAGTTLINTPLSFIVSDTPVSPPISPPISAPISGDPDQRAKLNFVLGLDGIGTTERINIGGNKNPNETTKQLNFQLRNPLNNDLVFDVGNWPFTYNPISQKYETTYDFPVSVADGTYNVYVFGSPYISKRYPVSVSVKKGQTTNLNSPQFYLVAGNIDDGGQSHDYIDIRDYNVLMSCSIFSRDSTVCDSDANFLKHSDLNSDGLVDQSDYTLWLKEKSKQKGDLPE